MKKGLLMLCCSVCIWGSTLAQFPYPSAPAPAPDIVQAEYFYDTDPGTGNGEPIAITAGQQINDLTTSITINGAALTPGLHRLYIRTKDFAGVWSLTNSVIFSNAVVVPYPASPVTPNFVKAEYFIDVDPGSGNGVEIPLPATDNINAFNIAIPLTGLNAGIHMLYVRVLDALGKWSLTNYSLFNNSVFTPYPTAPAPAPAMSEAEYYLDTDPGFGAGAPISFPAATDIVNFSFDIPLGAVTQGQHTIYIRSRQNPWSFSAYAEFIFGSPLPLSWLYVKAEEKNDDVYLQWATAMEENTSSFIIEYSTNGVNYKAVGEVKAENKETGSVYKFIHQRPESGPAYYRIKQTDKDGKYTWSKVVMLLINNNLKAPVLFPNPARDVVHVAIPGGMQAAQITVYDANGRQLKAIPGINNTTVYSIPVNEFKKGYYFVSIKTGSTQKSFSFIKE
ncbi:T9SS type A sorting domain-containing protein [Niastella sp. OAS944]|uniref:T9SS type A sorting domain-containing protein n=1 Tax=Niastella sp. OAS944 TaxID=2664089 RepID=UPI00347F66D4|nr:hypothetical protein [Chitinophagaceae bacterium OAS944]